jgi:hypothetical protein
MSINLNKYSFNQWLKFVFDHPVSDPEWYWKEEWEWEGDPNLVLEYSIKLFRNPSFLLDEYSPEQIEQGFWFLMGPTGEVYRWIWNEDIDWLLRRECIISMVDVFEQLFAKNPLNNENCYMWWDHLRTIEDNPDPKVREAMFEALSHILKMESHECQVSALHGLGHLEHEGKRALIEGYLASHPGIDAGIKEYALAAIEGRVL